MRAAFMLVASDADRPMCYMIQHGIGITLHNFTLHTLHLGQFASKGLVRQIIKEGEIITKRYRISRWRT